MATTDEAKLRELLAEVTVDSEALAAMLAALAPAEPKDGLTDPDDVPEPPDEAVTKRGLWLLGEHRLLCGDAGSLADLEATPGPDVAYRTRSMGSVPRSGPARASVSS